MHAILDGTLVNFTTKLFFVLNPLNTSILYSKLIICIVFCLIYPISRYTYTEKSLTAKTGNNILGISLPLKFSSYNGEITNIYLLNVDLSTFTMRNRQNVFTNIQCLIKIKHTFGSRNEHFTQVDCNEYPR